MVGAFEKRTIEGFLKRLALGQETIERYEPPLPAIVQREPWNGNDGEMPLEDDGRGKDEL